MRNFLILNKNMKELFSKVLHYVPFPAAAKNLVVSELPPSSRQHQDLSRRIGKLSKSKNIKNNLQRFQSARLFFLFSPDKGVTRRSRVQGFKRYGRRCLHIKTMSLEPLPKSKDLCRCQGLLLFLFNCKP